MLRKAITGMSILMGIVEEVCSVWNALEIVHGNSRHNETESSVEHANMYIQSMLKTCLETNRMPKFSLNSMLMRSLNF
jgi:hypothetical protein